MPTPIQLGSLTDRLRKFLRIRGKLPLLLDEVVVPTVLIQDLTKGPYQAGVTPSAGQETWVSALSPGTAGSIIILLNDKPGSLTPVLGPQFDGRSFSVTYVEMQNVSLPGGAAADEGVFYDDLRLQLVKREDVVAIGVPAAASNLTSIQENDGTRDVPVEIVTFQGGQPAAGKDIWRGVLGDNFNVAGSLRAIEPEPNITIGPSEAIALYQPIIVGDPINPPTPTVRVHIRGFYQQQPN